MRLRHVAKLTTPLKFDLKERWVVSSIGERQCNAVLLKFQPSLLH